MQKMRIFITFLLTCCFCLTGFSQTNVRGWYAKGQVWIVWENSLPTPETYAIYSSPSPFTSTNAATLTGRLFEEEWLPFAGREQIALNATYRIPDDTGGTYQLLPNEGVFVFTPHQQGQLYFAVVKWGDTAAVAGVNRTDTAVTFQYDPIGDPVQCHHQGSFASPFAPTYTCHVYYMWADGRQNQWEGRPDFPVMANEYKNGMPSMFLVSAPQSLDTTVAIPETVWLHGGGGTAHQSIAGSRPIVGLLPNKGILVAHNDDLFGYRGANPPSTEHVSTHFGWRSTWNPFDTNNYGLTIDTVVNYTQRRYHWIDQWLIQNWHVDPANININGHSMGAFGSTAMAKTYPEHYATLTAFNNGFEGIVADTGAAVLYGINPPVAPTPLSDRSGAGVLLGTVFDITHRNAAVRDFPLIRIFNSKNDLDGTMKWDALIVQQYREADSLGFGAQLNWSERAHGIDTGPAYADHWHRGNMPTQQTVMDNVAVEETFRSDRSFPAFFNHRYDPLNNDPGDGTPGTFPAGDGDDWGTWGGWHRWQWDSITDVPSTWSVTAWLESEAVFDNDTCPHPQLTSELSIRKPQQFKRASGTQLDWTVKEYGTDSLLQSGWVMVFPDSVVVLPMVTVYPENIRKVVITVEDHAMSSEDGLAANVFHSVKIFPNPSAAGAKLEVAVARGVECEIKAIALDGTSSAFTTRLAGGKNQVSLSPFDALPAGFYVIEIQANGKREVNKWVKIYFTRP